jgi:hypothetical protein
MSPRKANIENHRREPQISPGFYRQSSLYQFIYSVLGLVLGFICIIGGIVLFFGGITGSVSWTAKMLGAESKVSDAAPGAVLFIVGIFMVLITRFKIKRYPR